MRSARAMTPLARLLASPSARVLLGFLAGLMLLGAAAPWLPMPDPAGINLGEKLASCSLAHPFGTDHLGRDLLSRLIWGIRTTLWLSLAAMAATAAAGILAGSIAGFCGGRIDAAIMRLCDVMLSFPSEVLILAIVGLTGPSGGHVVLACVIAKWAWAARMTRSIVRRHAGSGFVQFARASGAGGPALLLQHVLPAAAGELFVLMTVEAGDIVLLISTLSFLGLGVQPPQAEWGMMLAEAKDAMVLYPEQLMPAGLAIALLVCTFNWLGDELRDAFDPRHEIPGGGSQ